MDKSTPVYVERRGIMSWRKSTLFWGAILAAIGFCTWAGPARASCIGWATAEVIGQMPDLIFLTGQSSTVQSLDIQYTGVVGGFNCGIYIHSNIPGVGLSVNTQPLRFGDVTLDNVQGGDTEIGGSVNVGILSHLLRTFDVGVTEASLANVTKLPQHGAIEIYSWTKELCFPTCGLQRIGVINVYIMDANKQFPLTFPVTATVSNTDRCVLQSLGPPASAGARSQDFCGNDVWFDNPFTNGNPSARLLVTQNLNPNAGAQRYNRHNIGVRYDGTRWRIFNQDGAAMPLGASFNVRIEGNAPPVVGPASASSRVYIDDGAANLNPDAVVLATPNFNSRLGRFGRSGVYNPHPIGVDYDYQIGRWFIFNEDSAPMNAYASFNVKVYGIQDTLGVNTGVSIVQNPYRSAEQDSMIINRRFTNGKPSANVLITHNANESGRNAHTMGVWYDGYRYWNVFNEDQAALRADAAFNIVVPIAPRFGVTFGPVCCIIP